MGAVLALFTLLLLTLHLTNSLKSRRIQAMREQLICLLSGEAAARQIKSKLYAVIRKDEGCVQSIEQIRGIRTLRGLLVIAETADELSGEDLDALRREVDGDWYAAFLRRQFESGSVDSVLLVIKLAGTLGLRRYVPDIVREIYAHRANPHMQNIGLLALCLLQEESALTSICRDPSIASLLSFRTLEELFSVYRGDREVLCSRLINTAADQYIRRTCVKAIGEHRYVSLAKLVLPLLGSPQLNMQIDAVRTLGLLQFKPAYEQIAALAKSERWELRAIVATALSSYGADENSELLLGLLCDREWWVRYRAAEALSGCADTEEILRRAGERQDRFALEMLQFALDKKALCARKGVA